MMEKWGIKEKPSAAATTTTTTKTTKY